MVLDIEGMDGIRKDKVPIEAKNELYNKLYFLGMVISS